MKIKYFDPNNRILISEEEGKFFLLYEDGEKKETSDYYPNSQMWNGSSPFFPIDAEADSFTDLIQNDPQAFEIFVKYNFNVMMDMVNIANDPQLCAEKFIKMGKEVCLGCIEDIFNTIKGKRK